eukprot:scpid64874/ scgid19433/ 
MTLAPQITQVACICAERPPHLALALPVDVGRSKFEDILRSAPHPTPQLWLWRTFAGAFCTLTRFRGWYPLSIVSLLLVVFAVVVWIFLACAQGGRTWYSPDSTGVHMSAVLFRLAARGLIELASLWSFLCGFIYVNTHSESFEQKQGLFYCSAERPTKCSSPDTKCDERLRCSHGERPRVRNDGVLDVLNAQLPTLVVCWSLLLGCVLISYKYVPWMCGHWHVTELETWLTLPHLWVIAFHARPIWLGIANYAIVGMFCACTEDVVVVVHSTSAQVLNGQTNQPAPVNQIEANGQPSVRLHVNELIQTIVELQHYVDKSLELPLRWLQVHIVLYVLSTVCFLIGDVLFAMAGVSKYYTLGGDTGDIILAVTGLAGCFLIPLYSVTRVTGALDDFVLSLRTAMAQAAGGVSPDDRFRLGSFLQSCPRLGVVVWGVRVTSRRAMQLVVSLSCAGLVSLTYLYGIAFY